MSTSKFTVIAALLAVAEARFGQEQVPVAAVSALGDAGFGDPGVAATIAGSIPSALLAAASPCDKVSNKEPGVRALLTVLAVDR
jgi:hypothetical protein